MTTRKRIAQVSLCLAALSSVGFVSFKITNSRAVVAKPTTPHFILWAWERATDLRFIDTRKIAVAFLAKSILLTANEVKQKPRLQSLQIPDGTKVIAVTRIETDRDHEPNLSADQRQVVARAIADLASFPNVSEVQIDFDATLSERSFYRDLIADVRRRLPATTRLSITALASWCMHDDWLSHLPIDEAVPMLFRMAADGKQLLTQLDAGDDFIAPPCRQSYGISLDEQRPKMFPDRKLFVFNPRAWTESTVREISEPSR
jgi:hypothetical protein